MHSIHYHGAVFPYEELGRRPAKENLEGYEGLHKINSKTLKFHPLFFLS
jgi:hypothetical protein